MALEFSLVQEALKGKYILEREIGRGGMAAVYLAREREPDRAVAIKVLDPELSSVLGSARFLKEIETVANLTHPHILPLHASGTANGLLYFVMPFAEGESLRIRLEREKKLPVEEAIKIASEIANALAYAHSSGVIHRDVKPANILLESGHAVLADFGIAQALAIRDSEDPKLTRPGISLGTPAYMSPEQVGGSENLDERSDQYSLACVLWEMLAGEPLFSGQTSSEIQAKKLGKRPLPIRAVRSAVPRAIEDTLRRALEKTPADRFSNMGEFRDALSEGAGSRTTTPWLLGLANSILKRWVYKAAIGYAVLVALGAGVLRRLQEMGSLEAVPAEEATIAAYALLPIVAGVAWALDPGTRYHPARPGEHQNWFGRLASGILRGRTSRVVISGVLSIVLMFAFWPKESVPEEPTFDPLENHLAILYFDSRGGGEDLQFFSEQLTEDLILEFTRLQKFSPVRVFASGAVIESKNDLRPGLDIAKELRAEFVLDGTVQSFGDSVSVQYSLEQAWSRTPVGGGELREGLSGPLDSDFVRRISSDLSREIRPELGDAVRRRAIHRGGGNEAATRALDAAHAVFDHALDLLFRADVEGVPEELDLAWEQFEYSAQLDDDWAEPYVCMARVAEWKAVFFGELQDPIDPTAAIDAVDQGLAALRRALDLDPESSRALSQQGELLYWKWTNLDDVDAAQAVLEDAELSLRAAVRQDPTLARAFSTLALIHIGKGEYQEAKIRALQGIESDAFLENVLSLANTLAMASANLGESSEARRYCQEVQDNSPSSGGYECELEVLAWGEGFSPDPDEARRLSDTTLALGRWERQPDFRARVLFDLAAAYARVGHIDSAGVVMEEARGLLPDGALLWQEAGAELMVGNSERAMEIIEGIVREDPVRGPGVISRRVFAPLEDDPRFIRLLSGNTG